MTWFRFALVLLALCSLAATQDEKQPAARRRGSKRGGGGMGQRVKSLEKDMAAMKEEIKSLRELIAGEPGNNHGDNVGENNDNNADQGADEEATPKPVTKPDPEEATPKPVTKPASVVYMKTGFGKCQTRHGKKPQSKYHPKVKDRCKELCSADAACGGYSLAKGAGNCKTWLETKEQPLVGDRKNWGSADCMVKLIHQKGTYTGEYADLGIGTCQCPRCPGRKLGQKYYKNTDGAKCKELCNTNGKCSGYSVSQLGDPHCMLWLAQPFGQSLYGGGAWDKRVAKGKCFAKLVPGQMQFKTATTIVDNDDDETIGEGNDDDTPISNGDDMNTYRRRRTVPPGAPQGGSGGKGGKGLR